MMKPEQRPEVLTPEERAALLKWAQAEDAPRCPDCGAPKATHDSPRDCVAPQLLVAAQAAAGTLGFDEQDAMRWLARMVAFGGEDERARIATIAGLFSRAATNTTLAGLRASERRVKGLLDRQAAERARAQTEPPAPLDTRPWFVVEHVREHGHAVRCRACSERWEFGGAIPERCPALVCKFGGGSLVDGDYGAPER